MSNFKIQIFNQSSQLEIKKITLSKIPKMIINIESIPLLNYPLDQLVEIIDQYFTQNPPDKLYILKTLKILTHSLGDSVLMSKIQSIIASRITQQSKLYNLLILWSSICPSFYKVLMRFKDNTRKQLVNIIFCSFLFQNNHGEDFLKVQLGQLLKIQNKNHLINHLKAKYKQYNGPLKLCIKKWLKIKTQNAQLLKCLREWAQFCINSSENKLLQLIKDIKHLQLNYLIQNITNINSLLIKQLKMIITQQNIKTFTSQHQKINIIYQTAIKQWINQANNYWKIVNKYFNNNNYQYFHETILLGKELNRQNLQNQSIIIKILYNYMEGRRFNFQIQDKKLNQYEKQSWMDAYRGITMANSYNRMNFIVININSSIKWWDQVNPYKNKSKNDKLNKFIDMHRDFVEQKQKEYGLKNKKLEIVYNTFLIENKQNKKQFLLSYQQLLLYLDNKIDLNSSTFQKIYAPYKIEIKQIKQQNKKQHNIIIEAKLVKLLKKHKQSLTFQFLSKESGYSIQIVQLGLKRLVSKGLAEQDQKGKGYNYIP